MRMKPQISIIILNWNGKDLIRECLDSLQKQVFRASVIVVDNGSKDGSMEIIESEYPEIKLIKKSKNHGFAGGMNIGINEAINNNADAIALLNNDANPDKNWLNELQKVLFSNKNIGAVTPKILNQNGKLIDSTGDLYSIWGLTIAGQRDEPATKAKDKQENVFGASAGASLYRSEALKDVGFFDDRFFAYYEDTDLSFRLRLKGWRIIYTPKATVNHATGSTSSKISGFTTYQTMKNLPMLFWKNTPARLLPKMLPRFLLAYSLILINSLFKNDRRLPALKGFLVSIKNTPHTFNQRRKIQKSKKVSSDYIWSILYKDLPPTAHSLRRFRSFFTLNRY